VIRKSATNKWFKAVILGNRDKVILVRSWRKSGDVCETFSIPRWYWDVIEPLNQGEMLMSFLSKGRPAAVDATGAALVEDPDMAKRWPALHEYLTAGKYPDDSRRERSKLSVSVSDDGWKGQVRDVDRGLVIWATDRSLTGLLDALEDVLTAEEPPWRVDKFAPPQQPKKGQKKT